MFSETKVTEIYRIADDFCKEIAQFQGKYMVECIFHAPLLYYNFISNSLSTITTYCFLKEARH